MAFWSDGVTEPRRNFKFSVDLGGGEEFIPVYTVMSTNLPTVTIGEASVNYLNHTFYYPGRVAFNTIGIRLIDAIDEEISSKLLQKISDAGYKVPSSQTEAQTSLTPKSALGLGNVELKQLGGGNNGLNKRAVYTLKNAWIKDVNFEQSLDYGNESVSGIAITLRYDFFTFAVDGAAPTGFQGA